MSLKKNRYNTFWKRLVAGLIDGVLFMPLYYLIALVTDDSINKIIFSFFIFLVSALYSVLLHGKYGQTLGKRLMSVKVYDIDEHTLIGFKRAFYRDSVWIILETITVIYFISLSLQSAVSVEQLQSKYDNLASTMSLFWFIIEILTMLSNSKRRAVHDYLGKSTVINLD